jgi:hypothetical protein
MLPRLALVTKYNVNALVGPAIGGNLTAESNTNSSCAQEPSLRLAGNVTVTLPNSAWCGGSSNSTLATGVYALFQDGSPDGTTFSHFQCYDISNGTAGAGANVTNVNLQANQAWVCVAGEVTGEVAQGAYTRSLHVPTPCCTDSRKSRVPPVLRCNGFQTSQQLKQLQLLHQLRAVSDLA